MKLEWDEAKNRANIRKHGFDFVRCGRDVSRLASRSTRDTRDDYGERRWIGIGMIQRPHCLCGRLPNARPDTIRIISLRKADREERKQYEKAIQDGLEAD